MTPPDPRLLELAHKAALQIGEDCFGVESREHGPGKCDAGTGCSFEQAAGVVLWALKEVLKEKA